MRTVPALVVVGFAAGALAFAAPSGADASGVATSPESSGAIGARASISVHGDPPTISTPAPSVTLPSSGARVSDSAPAFSVHLAEADAPFGGRFLDTGPLAVSSQRTADPSATTGSASAADVLALGGALTTLNLNSTCTSASAGAHGATTLTKGTLALSADETITLPSDPAPNTTFSGTSTGPGPGDTFTVVLNEQTSSPGSITVNAVHVILHGPSAVGDIVIAGSSCPSPADAPSTATPPATPASPAEPVHPGAPPSPPSPRS
ncbi:MAG: choice-of-anchor P family protein, partial [Acidimicrobiales bacterium]